MGLEFWTTTPIRCPKPPVTAGKKNGIGEVLDGIKALQMSRFRVYFGTENRGVPSSSLGLAIGNRCK